MERIGGRSIKAGKSVKTMMEAGVSGICVQRRSEHGCGLSHMPILMAMYLMNQEFIFMLLIDAIGFLCT